MTKQKPVKQEPEKKQEDTFKSRMKSYIEKKKS